MLDEVVAHIPCTITDELNAKLSANFTREEVVVALKQMETLKAPRPDGLPPLFFQRYWHVVGDDVTEVVLSCLSMGSFLIFSIVHSLLLSLR